MFKHLTDNRLAELDYDASKYADVIRDYFDNEIMFRNIDYMSGEKTYHIDYGPVNDREAWFFLTKNFVHMMKDAGSTLDFDQFKHTLKYTFISLPPGHILVPHTAAYIRAMCSVNIPLKGITKIDLYEDAIINKHEAGRHILKHHYTNPIILNVNQFHGVINDADTERVVLKIHMMVTPFNAVRRSFEGEKIDIFSQHQMPWNKFRGSYNALDNQP